MNLSSWCVLSLQVCAMGEPAAPPKKEIPNIVGKPAMEFQLQLRGTDKTVSLKEIDPKKIIVIEFWATWCAPCLSAFPHYNELVKKFDDRVAFFAVTYHQNETKLKEVLKKVTIASPIAIDRDFKMFRTYNAWAIPQTIIIDRDRVIVASVHPNNLTEELIQNVLDGKKLDIPDNGVHPYFEPERAEKYFREMDTAE